MVGLYKDLPEIIKEACKEMGTTPEKIGLELDKEGRNKTIWDVNPTKRDLWYRFETTVRCSQCDMDVTGHLILEKKSLSVVDSDGFIIMDKPVCSKCIGD